MEEKLNQLKARLAEISDLTYTGAVLSWDMQTYMPSGGAEDRGNLLSTISRLEHERWMSDELGQLLDDLKSAFPADSDEEALVRVARENYDKRVKVPAKWVQEFSQNTSVAQEVWARSRQANDFATFLPYLQRNIEMRREYSSFFAPYDHVYDPQLDDFEPGMKTSEVQAIFDELRSEQVALVKAVAARPQVDFSFLFQPYDEQKQWDFGVEVVTRFGYDWNRGRQDKTAHPFCTSFGANDVRITTRVNPNYPGSMLFGTMHESGHALYDLGHNKAYARTPLYSGASMAVHESQSRMWENLVGRSLAFWKFFYPRMQEIFPSQLGNVPLEAFYKAVNRLQPTLIRVEADEATYNLHIMLRLELEIALMEGSLEPKDLPEAWNERMRDYLGLTPPDVAKGVMQDVHWSAGYFGYFPTYALGNLVSVQLWDKINQDLPDLDAQFEKGEFGTLLGWLRENVHTYGAKYKPQDLVKKVTGSKIDPKPYLRYLKTKFSDIYGL